MKQRFFAGLAFFLLIAVLMLACFFGAHEAGPETVHLAF